MLYITSKVVYNISISRFPGSYDSTSSMLRNGPVLASYEFTLLFFDSRKEPGYKFQIWPTIENLRPVYTFNGVTWRYAPQR